MHRCVPVPKRTILRAEVERHTPESRTFHKLRAVRALACAEDRSADCARPSDLGAVTEDVELYGLVASRRRQLHQPDHRPREPSRTMFDINGAFRPEGRQLGTSDMYMERRERVSEQSFIRRTSRRTRRKPHGAELTSGRRTRSRSGHRRGHNFRAGNRGCRQPSELGGRCAIAEDARSLDALRAVRRRRRRGTRDRIRPAGDR